LGQGNPSITGWERAYKNIFLIYLTRETTRDRLYLKTNKKEKKKPPRKTRGEEWLCCPLYQVYH